MLGRLKPAAKPDAAPTPGGPLRTDLGPAMRWGLGATVALFALVFGWAAMAVIGGAVIAQGQIMVQGNPRVVQHLDGGLVAEIAVADGDTVRAGQVLLRLDPTMPALNLGIAEARLAEALARRARLEAEHLGLDEPDFTWPALPFPVPDTAAHEIGQRQIFNARAELRRTARERLAERQAQIESQLGGLAAQTASRDDQLALIEADIENLTALASRGLARSNQITELQRSRAGLLGEIAAFEAEAARARIALRDAELETRQGERAFYEQVVTDLRTASAEIDELALEIVTRRAQLDRIEIRAPASGVVHELAVTTPGAVVAPGATLLEVIPRDEGVAFELRVEPRDIDQIWLGQPARVMVASFDPQSTPPIAGHVAQISPAAVTDPRSGASFYRIGLEVPAEDLARLGGDLVPGMPVEAFLQTSERTALAYLTQPLRRMLDRAFREE